MSFQFFSTPFGKFRDLSLFKAALNIQPSGIHIQVSEGTDVDFEVRDGQLVVHPVKQTVIRLEDLLKNCKPSQLHEEVDYGRDVGREVIK